MEHSYPATDCCLYQTDGCEVVVENHRDCCFHGDVVVAVAGGNLVDGDFRMVVDRENAADYRDYDYKDSDDYIEVVRGEVY